MRPLFHPILHAAHLIEAQLRDALAPIGLHPRQARMLMAIAENGPLKQAQLALAFDLAPPTVTIMLTRLARDGLINRHSVADQKQTAIALTEAGRALIPEIERAWMQVDRMLCHSIGTSQAEGLSQTARKLRDALGGKPPHAKLGDDECGY
ncbi:MarR family winged helix-turn-helix transcriptional regulator [Candidatus Phycosocius bacilliformis]|nr:MarR family transcriptional regulator [Candidatus Phycosocius bacilliformis]